MSQKTSIEWTESTWNPVRGCSRVSEGCRNCYAEEIAARFSGPGLPFEGFAKRVNGDARWTGKVELIPKKLIEPLSWKEPRMIFVNSMSDLFHEDHLFNTGGYGSTAIAAVFGIMAEAHWHTFQILTKRTERALSFYRWMESHGWRRTSVMHEAIKFFMGYDHPRRPAVNNSTWPLPNVWLVASVEDQPNADKRIPELLECPAIVHGLSCEPLLGEINLRHIKVSPPDPEPMLRPVIGYVNEIDALTGEFIQGRFGFRGSAKIDWVIVGGESGRDARPCDLSLVRDIVAQCKGAGVPVFVKQLGAKPWDSNAPLYLRHGKGGDPAEWPADLRVRELPRAVCCCNQCRCETEVNREDAICLRCLEGINVEEEDENDRDPNNWNA